MTDSNSQFMKREYEPIPCPSPECAATGCDCMIEDHHSFDWATCKECGAQDTGARQGINHAVGCMTAGPYT
jgi:hypothetical protein